MHVYSGLSTWTILRKASHLEKVLSWIAHGFFWGWLGGGFEYIFFIFTPYLGKISNLTYIFQMGLKPPTRWLLDANFWKMCSFAFLDMFLEYPATLRPYNIAWYNFTTELKDTYITLVLVTSLFFMSSYVSRNNVFWISPCAQTKT